jgi:formate dehydrogenase maturation protein FdhE
MKVTRRKFIQISDAAAAGLATSGLGFDLSEEEEGYRVDVCDQCRKYIKTFDTRKIKRPVYLFVEQLTTLHLDMLAQNQGLQSGHPLWLKT